MSFTFPMKEEHSYHKNSLNTYNQSAIQHVYSASNLMNYNSHLNTKRQPANPRTQGTQTNITQPPLRQPAAHQTQRIQTNITQTPLRQPAAPTPVSQPSQPFRPLPIFHKPVQKGQKVPLSFDSAQGTLEIYFGWNTKNPLCDIDVSAFLLGKDGKVLGEDWFVFYGQPKSPDGSVAFFDTCPNDREYYTINFKLLHPAVERIVFVLTINDALEHHLNFSMLQDAYIRILHHGNELVSFKMTEYYSNIISMMIGELYFYKGNWKFNAIGNGIARDLAGLCAYYGVQVI